MQNFLSRRFEIAGLGAPKREHCAAKINGDHRHAHAGMLPVISMVPVHLRKDRVLLVLLEQ